MWAEEGREEGGREGWGWGGRVEKEEKKRREKKKGGRGGRKGQWHNFLNEWNIKKKCKWPSNMKKCST